MADVFTNLQMDFIFSIRSYCKKKRYMKYFAFASKWKYEVVQRKLVVSERTPNLFLHIHTYICID